MLERRNGFSENEFVEADLSDPRNTRLILAGDLYEARRRMANRRRVEGGWRRPMIDRSCSDTAGNLDTGMQRRSGGGQKTFR